MLLAFVASSFIQSAINNAGDGEVIVLPKGIYYETTNFMGKAITIRRTNPADPEVVSAAIIDGYENGRHIVRFKSIFLYFKTLEGRGHD